MDERERASAFDSKEWFDNDYIGRTTITLPEPDEDYFYFGTRLLSWWPYVNSRGATYEREDFDDDLLDTLMGKQVNIHHDKGRVVGTVIAREATPEGIDIGVRVDREQAEMQNLEPEDLVRGNNLSSVSVELTKNPEQSQFYAYDDGFNVKQRYPVTYGKRMGVRRTTANDPFLLQGRRVAERIKPARFTGVGIVPNPADRTAQLFAVAASETSEETPKTVLVNLKEVADGKKPYGDVHYADPGFQSDGVSRYPLDTPEHIDKAAQYFGKGVDRAEYNAEQRAHIDHEIEEAEKIHGLGKWANKETQTASSDAGTSTKENPMSEADAAALRERVTSLEGQVANLTAERETASSERDSAKARIVELEQELASATAERDTLKTEKETAAREARIDVLVGELEAIHPCANDDERTALREVAAKACDDSGVIHTLKLERTVKAQEHKIAELQAAAPAAAAPEAPKTSESTDEAEAASAETEREQFSASKKPEIGVGGTYEVCTSRGKVSTESLYEAF